MLFNSSSLPKTMLFFRLHCFKWILHASQHEVCKQFIEQTYIRNRPEIRHGLCCTCFRQHSEKRNLPGRWDISTCEHLGHYVQQGVQKIIRRMFQKFCNKAQIIASPADLQARYSMLQLCHSPRWFGQRRPSHGRPRVTMEQACQHFCEIISMRLICNFIARRPKNDPQHFPRWKIAQISRKFSRSPQAKFLSMELSDMERQFLPPHGINSLAPVVAEVPERWVTLAIVVFFLLRQAWDKGVC